MQVKKVIVMGHSSCGGIKALMTMNEFDKYARPLTWTCRRLEFVSFAGRVMFWDVG